MVMRLLDTPLMRPRLAGDARDAKRRGIERRKRWRRIGSAQTGHKAAAPFAKEQAQHAHTKLNSADSGARRANPSPPPQAAGRHPRAPTPGDFFTPETIFQTGVVFTCPNSSDMLKDLARSCELRPVEAINRLDEEVDRTARHVGQSAHEVSRSAYSISKSA